MERGFRPFSLRKYIQLADIRCNTRHRSDIVPHFLEKYRILVSRATLMPLYLRLLTFSVSSITRFPLTFPSCLPFPSLSEDISILGTDSAHRIPPVPVFYRRNFKVNIQKLRDRGELASPPTINCDRGAVSGRDSLQSLYRFPTPSTSEFPLKAPSFRKIFILRGKEESENNRKQN